MKTPSFDEVVKNTIFKIINEQGAPGAPPAPPADPTKISADDKEQLDPVQFVNARIKSLIDLGADSFIDNLKKMNTDAKKPLQIKSLPIDQSENIEDFVKSFKKNYAEDYATLKRFIDVTNEGAKFDMLKKDIKDIIRLSKEYIDTDQESITPSNVAAAPM